MKTKLFFTAIAIAVSMGMATAQEYKAFKVGLGAGYAIPGGEGSGGGVLFTVEPAYRLSDAIALGLRMEWAVVTRGISESQASYNASAAAISSYTVNGNYYLSNEKFRPYVGAGLGLFSLASVSVGTSSAAAAETKFGFYPRAGFDLGHFNVALEYNIVPATEIPNSDLETKNSYFGIRIGAFFGGGKK